MQKIDKQKMEIQIASGYWDWARSGVCVYDGRPCWFEEVIGGMGIGEDTNSNSPFYNANRSKFELYALTKTDLDLFVNRSKYYAKCVGVAHRFYKNGNMLSHQEAIKTAESFEIDKNLDTTEREINKSCCIGFYYDGAPINTFDVDIEDISHTYQEGCQNPSEASVKRLKELRPMLELFKQENTYLPENDAWFIVSATYDGGLLVEFEFSFNTSLDISIDKNGNASFAKCTYTKEYKDWCNTPAAQRSKTQPENIIEWSNGTL